MASTISERQMCPPVECAPWCEYQDDPGFFAGDVGWCYGPLLRTPLSIEKPVAFPDGPRSAWAAVYVHREPGRPDTVYLAHNEGIGMSLIPSEARQLIEHMQLVLGQIEATR